MIYNDNDKTKDSEAPSALTNKNNLLEFNKRYENYALTSNVVVERPVPKNITAEKNNKDNKE